MQIPDRYEPASGVAARFVGGETVVVDLDTEQYFSLNATGTVVWTVVSAGEPTASAADQLVEQFDVNPQQASNDVEELVAELVENGLLLPMS